MCNVNRRKNNAIVFNPFAQHTFWWGSFACRWFVWLCCTQKTRRPYSGHVLTCPLVSLFSSNQLSTCPKNYFFLLFIRPSNILWPNVLIIGKLVFLFYTPTSFSSSVTLVKANDLHKRNCSFCFVYWDVDFFWTKRVEWCPSACNRESIS